MHNRSHDPIAAGIAGGWKTLDAARIDADLQLDADVAIVGTGAGGGTAAEILSRAGLRVVLIEEGPLKSSRDFHMLESQAYPQLYQESAARKTKDKAINILQGRCVGGSTTVNWTSSFRTPPATLGYWQKTYGLNDYTVDALEPWFAAMERRLGIARWAVPPNENNAALQRGAAKLQIPTGTVHRNVRGCWNLGYCGMGCPTNAKQSMLVTTIPSALWRGAVLVSGARAQRFSLAGDAITGLSCTALDALGVEARPYTITVNARHYVAAAGAIGSPALLMRSSVPDPGGALGKRTFLHPVSVSAATMPHRVAGFSGAPQSIYSDHFLDTQPLDGPIGFKLEVPPVHPVLAATTLCGFGPPHAAQMANLPVTQVAIALMRDGFDDRSRGGAVELRSDGTPVLDYPISDYVWEGLRRALGVMAQIQFAAGATSVLPVHEDAVPYDSWAAAEAAIGRLPMEILRARVVSAHVMGGCAMGTDPTGSVVRGDGGHHQVRNLSVFDGSVFPTSLGANPQLSIYGIVARNATRLATRLTTARAVPPP
jgi:choline dehydrogenase-like flavoprotein